MLTDYYNNYFHVVKWRTIWCVSLQWRHLRGKASSFTTYSIVCSNESFRASNEEMSLHIITSSCIGVITSPTGNISRVTGHFCGEFTGDRWIPRTKASGAELWCSLCDLRLNKRLSKQSWGWWFETKSGLLWRHRNGSTHTSIRCIK